MDRAQRERRDQRDRCRGILQCPRLRPDVRHPRDAPADPGDDARGRSRSPGPDARRRQADRRNALRRRYQAARGRGDMSKPSSDQDTYYRGIPTVPYDLLKEIILAFVASGIVILVLAVALSSPDIAPVTIQAWAGQDPIDLVTTATSELAGTSFSAAYGPPYTGGSESVQAIGPFAPQSWAGNAVHLDAAQDFVLGPLGTAAVGNPDLASALGASKSADDATRQSWLSAYTDALGAASTQNGNVVVAT